MIYMIDFILILIFLVLVLIDVFLTIVDVIIDRKETKIKDNMKVLKALSKYIYINEELNSNNDVIKVYITIDNIDYVDNEKDFKIIQEYLKEGEKGGKNS